MENVLHLQEKFKLLLIGPAFIGDLPELYRTRFKENLDTVGGLLKFVDSCDFLRLRDSYVEFSDSKSGPVSGNLQFGTLEGRLKFLLPSTRARFYEDLPELYRLVFGETFDCGSDLLHFIESQSYLEIYSYVFVKYSDAAATNPRPLPVGNPRHKEFLTRRFIYLLRLFPKSPADLIKIYKEKFGDDLPVQPRILPAIFRNFLGDYFMVSAADMIYFAAPTGAPKPRPEIPRMSLGVGSDPNCLLIERLVYLRHQMKLEARYLQFMYYDVFGEPINDLATLERFINTAYSSASGSFDRALVWVPNGQKSSNERIREFLANGPMSINDLFNAWSAGRPMMVELFRENSAFLEILRNVPGVIASSTVRLADSSLEYVHQQLERLVDNCVKLNSMPDLFKKVYGYTIPDDYLVREYVLAPGVLRIDENENVIKIPETPPSRTSTPGPASSTGNAASSNAGDKLETQQKKNILKLLSRRATRFDKIRMEYEARFGHELKLNTKLSAWLQTIEGVHFDLKNQIVYSKLNEAQAKVITVVLERKEINFEKIPDECRKKFGKELVYNGDLKPWLCNIPGMVISSSKMCSYNSTMTGGSMLDLSAKTFKSTFSKSTPDIRPRSQEEQAIDLIIANPNTTINDFLKLFNEKYGKFPNYQGKLKTYLLSIPGVQVSPNDRISMGAKDVATNAKQNISEILKHKNWVPVDEFAEIYKKLFSVTASQTWIQSRQKEINFLMLLDNKVRYDVLTPKLCLQYVKHLANLCNGLAVHQVKSFFHFAYGFALPEEMYDLTVQSYPTGKIEAGPPTNLEVEILAVLKDLSSSQRRVLLHLMQRRSWIRIEDLLRETFVKIPDNIDEVSFCESIPNVMVKDSRIRYQGLTPSSLLKGMERIVSWLTLVHVSELPMLAKRLFGHRVKMEDLPLEDLKLSASVYAAGDFLSGKPQQPAPFPMQFTKEKLFEHSDNQLHRLFKLVAANPNIELSALEIEYQTKFGAPIVSWSPSLKLFIDQYPEFSTTNAKVTLAVPLSAALKEPRKLSATDLARNLLSAQVPASKPTQSLKLNNAETREGPHVPNVRPTTLMPNIVSNSLNGESSDSRSDVGIAGDSAKASGATNPGNAELSLFESLIGGREREIKVLCNDYKNKFKTPIVEGKLEQILLSAGYCCVDGRVHPGCKDRLRFLLSVRKLDQTGVIIEFQTMFGRSPCYSGTLRRYLLSIGCEESAGKLFRFPISRSSTETIDEKMLERLLPIIGFRNKSVDVLHVLEEYNNRHDPPLTQEALVAELGKLDFVALTKKKKAFDCGGIHEASVAAMRAYTRMNENTFSLAALARELPAKTATQLMCFGNLLKTLQKAGFSVSNDVISLKKEQNTREQTASPQNKPSSIVDLTEIRAVIKDLVREDSPISYDDLETKFRKAIGYNLRYSLLGCSNFPSFLRVYLPNDGMVFENEVVTYSEASDISPTSGSSRTSPSRSSDQSEYNVFDVIRVSGSLLYPSELQARFAQLTGSVLKIPDPDTYLLSLLKATELIVKSDHCGNIRVSKASIGECDEELFRSAEEDSASGSSS